MVKELKIINRYTKLVRNSLTFAIGNFGSKFISILLVPLYTYVLSSADYGKIDLVITTTNLVLPIFFLSITEAILRFSIDDTNNLKNTLSSGLLLTFVLSVIAGIFYPFIIQLIPNVDIRMFKYLLIILVLQQCQSLISQFTRARGEVLTYSINGILFTLITVLFNIVFLVILKLGIDGYFYSIIIANLFSIVFLSIKMRIINYIEFKSVTSLHLKEMLRYSIPLIPNMVMWWVVNSSTRYFILYFNGTSENGLYAVASKLPALITMLAAIFSQAWQLSSVEEYKSKDRETFFSKTFTVYSMLMMISSSALLIFLKPIMLIFIESSYFRSWTFVPPLVLAAVYSSFAGFIGTTYTAAKKTSGIFYSSIAGGIISILVSYFLIPTYGGVGAGISSLIGFVVIYLYRLKDTRKFISIKIDRKFFLFANVIYMFQWIALYISNNITMFSLQLLLFFLLLFISRNKIYYYFNLIKKNRR